MLYPDCPVLTLAIASHASNSLMTAIWLPLAPKNRIFVSGIFMVKQSDQLYQGSLMNSRFLLAALLDTQPLSTASPFLPLLQALNLQV